MGARLFCGRKYCIKYTRSYTLEDMDTGAAEEKGLVLHPEMFADQFCHCHKVVRSLSVPHQCRDRTFRSAVFPRDVTRRATPSLLPLFIPGKTLTLTSHSFRRNLFPLPHSPWSYENEVCAGHRSGWLRAWSSVQRIGTW